MKKIAIIPSLEPDHHLIDITKELKENNYEVIIVNDGSSNKYDKYFETAKDYGTVLTHKINQGKGEAQKNAFKYIKNHYQKSYMIITVDLDGQLNLDDYNKTIKYFKKPPDKFIYDKGIRNENHRKKRYSIIFTKILTWQATALLVLSREEELWVKEQIKMYKIGDFSKIVDIPVRTLRYYAEYGVLVPSEIDKFTGYKYYSEANVIECELIKLLKSLDFTLDEIIEYKDNIDEEILEKKKKEIEERIYLLKLKYDRLTYMQEEIKNKKSYTRINETEQEKVLRRKYEKRNVGKSA